MADIFSKHDVLAKWSMGCAACLQKGRYVRDGNWHPLEFVLRHKDCDTATVTVVEQDGSTILEVTPGKIELPPGKSAGKRPAFALIVR